MVDAAAARANLRMSVVYFVVVAVLAFDAVATHPNATGANLICYHRRVLNPGGRLSAAVQLLR